MLLNRNVLVIVVALVVSAQTGPSDDTRGSYVYDPDSIPQNEKLLRLLLRLASHTASRLIHLKKEAKLRDASTREAVVPAVRMNWSPSVLDEVSPTNSGRRGEDSKVKPVEIASRMLLDVDKNNTNATDVKENSKNTSGSGIGPGSGSGSGAGAGATNPTQGAKPAISSAQGSGIGDQAANATSSLRSGAKSPAQGAKSVISNAGGSGIANQAQNATLSLGSGANIPAQVVKSVIGSAGGSGIALQALNATSALLPAATNVIQGAGAKNAAQGIESVISSAGQGMPGKILQPVENVVQRFVKPGGLLGSIPLFRSFPDADNASSMPKSSASNATHTKDNSTKVSEDQATRKKSTVDRQPGISVTNDKTSKTPPDPKSRDPSAKNPAQIFPGKNADNAKEEEVSEWDLKGFALQFADALRPVKSRRR